MTKTSLNWRLIESYELDDLKKFKRLLILGASPNVPSYVDKWEESLLTRSIFEGKNAYAKLLIDAGANLYDKLYNSSIVHAAVFQKNHDLLRYLYQKYNKSDLDIYDILGPPIFRAIARKDHATLQLLIELGADVNAASDPQIGYGDTVINNAVMNSDMVSVRMLLEAGGNPNKPGNMGNTAFDRVKEIEGQIGKDIEELLRNWTKSTK